MSSEPAIRIEKVGKTYPIYAKPHHRLLQALRGGGKRYYREFHALHDIEFDVMRGETLGIVGRNGSGKSTLLQIICGTLTPTVGKVEVRGRIAALLELGAGFNPEFTGRENLFLNGAVLGLARADLENRFDRIAAFADIGEFMEQPVKTYSSGMYVRLAFAIAINVDPDILVVDEALSVGDEAFQRKCHARLQTIRDNGATILFVSHSAGMVTELCSRAVLLDGGEQLLLGTPKFVVSRYHKLLYAGNRADEVRAELRAMRDDSEPVSPPPTTSSDVPAVIDDAHFDPGLVPQSTVHYPSRGATIEAPRLLAEDGRQVNVLSAGSTYTYAYRVRFDSAAFDVRCGMLIRTVTGLELGGGVTALAGKGIDCVDAGAAVEVRFRFRCLLAPGVYFLNAGALGRGDDGAEGENYLDRRVDVAMFRVQPDPERLATALVDLDVRPRIEVAEAALQ